MGSSQPPPSFGRRPLRQGRPSRSPRPPLRWAVGAVAAAAFLALAFAAFALDWAELPLPGPLAGWGLEPAAEAPAAPSRPAAPPAAVSALLAGDCPSALAALDNAGELPHRQLLTGFYSHACERPERAAAALAAVEPGGPLDDWRLLLLADSLRATGEARAAFERLGELVERYPTSPLAPEARVRRAEVARDAGWTRQALRLTAAMGIGPFPSEEPTLPGELAARAAALEWAAASELGDEAGLRRAARRLFTVAPRTADELGVTAATPLPPFAPAGPFAAAEGQPLRPDWHRFLGREGTLARTEALLAEGRGAEAVQAMATLPAESYDTEALLLHARALTAAQRGAEALPLLEGWAPRLDPGEAASLAAYRWALAQAQLEAATVRLKGSSGRENLPTPEREALRAKARRLLLQVAGQTARTDLAIAASRRLFADLVEEERFDDAMKLLAHLRLLDPVDDTGASYLWEKGWEQFQTRNSSGAVGYWAELMELYPETFDARRGRYWSARAQEELGRRARAQELYAEVASSDTRDFYHLHAEKRLRGEHPAPPARPEGPQDWPRTEILDRAELLLELGLDRLSLSEVEAVETVLGEAVLAPRAARAMEARAHAARGAHRPSILALLQTFDGLGSAHQNSLPEEALHLYYPLRWQEHFLAAARTNGLPPSLVVSIARQESAFDLTAVSRVGARGLMQLMPATGEEVARKLGIPFSTALLAEPETNTRLGSAYFRQTLDMFDGQVELALAGYNGGPYRVKRLWREAGRREMDYFIETLPMSESRTYTRRVLLLMDSYRRLYPEVFAGDGPPRPPLPAPPARTVAAVDGPDGDTGRIPREGR